MFWIFPAICVLLVVVGFFMLASSPKNTEKHPQQGQAPVMGLRRFYCATEVPPTDYTVIDTETTGLDAKTCEVIEIGAIKYRGHEEVSRYHTYVKPVGPLSPDAAAVNHITRWDVAKGKDIVEAAAELREFVGEDVIIGYNVAFDIKFIQTRTQEDLSRPAFDVLAFARDVAPGLESYKLTDMQRMCNISGGSHSALADCATTAAVYKHLLDTPAGQSLYAERIQKSMADKIAY